MVSKWNIAPEKIFTISPIIPVIQIHGIDEALSLAEALFAGGVNIMEITLRTPAALEAIDALTRTYPQALIGAGTVINPQQLEQVVQAGARFAFSPGKTQVLLEAGVQQQIPLIPGITSVSDLMEGLALGYSCFKFFPAVAAGGKSMLNAFYGPFPQARFCATGGINEQNFTEFLALPNVSCVGGSWIVPEKAIKEKNWSLITELCKKATTACGLEPSKNTA
ncbi:MAG: keto-deoxy-phosphogluconate aldolase [Legionella sp. 40-6]|nr:bifunctional 4-hydroxy-2-oxoglutarate aldolase/2-dehydro-3-deoxy-phosphogluconate aldolase [Legionella sp.]OJY34818.1 MAG: keto-deoxy-phosphogluconate aldolase [Legionella sp. 40-6]